MNLRYQMRKNQNAPRFKGQATPVHVSRIFRRYLIRLQGLMFCAQCKAEYLPGVTRCSDCNVALVEHLPESKFDSDGVLSDANLRGVWSGEDQNECVSICARLREVEIPFKVIQHKRQFLKGVDEHFGIGVPSEFWGQAKKIIDGNRVEFTDEASEQAIMELSAENGMANVQRTEEDRSSDKWNPKNATVEVWSGGTPELMIMIESSLGENSIHYRADVLVNGSRHIFVMPEDKLRGREIVREIKDGIPPK